MKILKLIVLFFAFVFFISACGSNTISIPPHYTTTKPCEGGTSISIKSIDPPRGAVLAAGQKYTFNIDATYNFNTVTPYNVNAWIPKPSVAGQQQDHIRVSSQTGTEDLSTSARMELSVSSVCDVTNDPPKCVDSPPINSVEVRASLTGLLDNGKRCSGAYESVVYEVR